VPAGGVSGMSDWAAGGRIATTGLNANEARPALAVLAVVVVEAACPSLEESHAASNTTNATPSVNPNLPTDPTVLAAAPGFVCRAVEIPLRADGASNERKEPVLFTSSGDALAVKAAVDLHVGKHPSVIDMEVQKRTGAQVERAGLPLEKTLHVADSVEDLFDRTEVVGASVPHGDQPCTAHLEAIV
jgi:hypothetical protein